VDVVHRHGRRVRALAPLATLAFTTVSDVHQALPEDHTHRRGAGTLRPRRRAIAVSHRAGVRKLPWRGEPRAVVARAQEPQHGHLPQRQEHERPACVAHDRRGQDRRLARRRHGWIVRREYDAAPVRQGASQVQGLRRRRAQRDRDAHTGESVHLCRDQVVRRENGWRRRILRSRLSHVRAPGQDARRRRQRGGVSFITVRGPSRVAREHVQ
ncbi:hypothetical protein Gpo141_00015118, partial [Globisporangium polare]